MDIGYKIKNQWTIQNFLFYPRNEPIFGTLFSKISPLFPLTKSSC